MSFKAILYAYILGGVTFIPLLIACIVLYTNYTSVPITDAEPKRKLHSMEVDETALLDGGDTPDGGIPLETNDAPRSRKGWLSVRRTFEELPNDSSYVNFVRTFLDARTKDPKRLRPKDMWYVVLKGKVLYLYEDEGMTECEGAIELSGYDAIIFPEGLQDGELFARRNAICLRPKLLPSDKCSPSVTMEMGPGMEVGVEQSNPGPKRKEKAREMLLEVERKRDAAQDEAFNTAAPWFMFVRSNTEMEDWYLALVHASEQPAQTPTLEPLRAVFEPPDMDYLVTTLDEQPDVIPMRWFNALIGRLFFSYYRTHILEAFIIGKLMKKLSKVKRPTFLSDVVVTEVSVGNKAPTFSKPMLKELTKEGDASMEVHARYKGEVRITVEATATINLGARLKSYTVKLVLAAILREIEGNMLIKVKRPPSNRIWYAFTQMPRIVLDVEPVVSDRQITWGMILSTIESRLKEIIQESVVLPNMDDIAFFETSSYSHRGGIWSDACRKRRAVVDIAQPANQTLPEAPEAEPQDGNPTLLRNDTIPAQSRATTEPLDQYVPESSSTDDIQSTEEPDTTEGLSVTTVASEVRRRSWFSSSKIDGSATYSLGTGEKQVDEEDARGRKFESIKAIPIGARSSKSRDGTTEVNPNDAHGDMEGNATSQQFLFPHEARRSSSRQSLRENHRRNNSVESNKSALERSTLTPPRKVSDAASTTSSSSSPPGTGSFFSTLRSKDRQAIRDSAKEAMRKLGVNWGLKKDWNSVPGGKEALMYDIQSIKEGTSSMLRASYADVTAAVVERRERKKMTVLGVADVTDMEASENEPSDVPDASDIDKAKDPAASSLPIPLLDSPDNRERRSLSKGPMETDAEDPPVEGHPPTPILVQPRGKTMTIPGIHASHRGEIMAMGYVAPAMAQTDSKYKNNPAINSFYRLLKSPVITDQESSQAPVDRALDNEDVTPLTLGLSSISTEPQLRPVPPPLPPRPIPITVSNPTPNASTSPTGGATSASQALRSIVTKDDDTRLRRSTKGLWSPSLEDYIEEKPKELPTLETHVDEVATPIAPASCPPPLPPRHIPTSV
ncbi:hypothetical protein AX15_004021 [Amanita polypyramis BW_CC]|nr:hypothetical protein AX15_004021 [Amanita polypyramis BW_CC]